MAKICLEPEIKDIIYVEEGVIKYKWVIRVIKVTWENKAWQWKSIWWNLGIKVNDLMV